MPDKYGFTHEVHWSTVYNRCTECDSYPWGVTVSEKERRRHHEGHERNRKKTQERERLANLAQARKLKQWASRESRTAYGEER